MNTLKSLVGNLAVVRYLVLNGRKYKRCDLERVLDAIDELLETPENLSTEELKAFQHYVTECITCFESLTDGEGKSHEEKQEIDTLSERLHQISDRCRQLEAIEQLVLRIMLTVKLYR